MTLVVAGVTPGWNDVEVVDAAGILVWPVRWVDTERGVCVLYYVDDEGRFRTCGGPCGGHVLRVRFGRFEVRPKRGT